MLTPSRVKRIGVRSSQVSLGEVSPLALLLCTLTLSVVLESNRAAATDPLGEKIEESAAEPKASERAANVPGEGTNEQGKPAEQKRAAGEAAADPLGDVDDTELFDMSLESLLDIDFVTATKTEQKIEKTPAVVSVITRENFSRYGYQSIADALRHVLGFYIVEDHILPNAAVRGIEGGLFGESSSIKVLINGKSVAFRARSGNWLGPELIPLSVVERVEILRGPASALYGADAFLGVVNIILRKGSSLKGGDIRAGINRELSNWGSDLDLAFGDQKGPIEFLVAARLSDEDRSGLPIPESSPAPRLPRRASSNREASHLFLDSHVGYGELTYHISDRIRLGLFGYYSAIDRGAELNPWVQLPYGLTAGGIQEETRIALHHGRTGFDLGLDLGDELQLKVQGVYFTGKPRDGDRIEVGSDIFYVRRKFEYNGAEASVEGLYQIRPNLSAVMGMEFVFDREALPSARYILKLDQGEARAGEVMEQRSVNRGYKDFTNFGLFGQLMWTPLDPLLCLTMGIRLDHHNIYGNWPSGRLGILSSPLPNLTIKALYGGAFKAPSPFLLYAEPFRVGDVLGNEDLKPQYIHTLEIQVAYSRSKRIMLSTGLTYNFLLDKAEFQQRGVNRVAENLSEMKTLSWESEILLGLSEWLHGYLNWEWVYGTRDLGQEGYLARLIGVENVIYPSCIGRLGLSGRIPGLPVRWSTEVIYASSRRASEMNIMEQGGSYRLDGYGLWDAALSSEGFHLVGQKPTFFTLRARNLTNAFGPDPGYAGVDFPLTPRCLSFEVRQEL